MPEVTPKFRPDLERRRHPNELMTVGPPIWDEERQGWFLGDTFYPIPIPPNSAISFAIARLVGQEKGNKAYRRAEKE